jgi:hypothetical protein
LEQSYNLPLVDGKESSALASFSNARRKALANPLKQDSIMW